MRLRKIGDYQYKGSAGIYLEAVDVPRTKPRYAAVDWEFLPDEIFPAIDRGEVFESTVLDADPHWWLHDRIDECFL